MPLRLSRHPGRNRGPESSSPTVCRWQRPVGLPDGSLTPQRRINEHEELDPGNETARQRLDELGSHPVAGLTPF
jgi:hypothetical protein